MSIWTVATSGDAVDPVALYRRSEYAICLRRLERADDDESFLLRLRSLMRLGRYREVIQPAHLERAAWMEPRKRFDACVLLGSAFHRSGMRVPAQDLLREARFLARELQLCASARAEMEYYDALRLWSMHDFDGADRLLDPLLQIEDWRGYALALRGWIAAARGDLKEQQRLLDQALTCPPEPYLIATTLHAASALAKELFDEARIARIRKEAESLPWTSDLAHAQFYTVRNLGWSAMLAGNLLKAHNDFRHALSLAGVEKGKIVASLSDLAFLADIVGDEETKIQSLLRAHALAKSVRWQDLDEERFALLTLVSLFATQEHLALAEECWDIYTALRTKITPILSFGIGDRRVEALEAAAKGGLLLAQGRTNDAVVPLKEAFRFFRSIGYTWRAVLCAKMLAQAQPRHATGLLQYATTEGERRFRRAWFAQCVTA